MVIKRIDKVKLDQHQFDALVILAYNIGGTEFKKEASVARLINGESNSNYASLEEAWEAYNKIRVSENIFETSDGLTNRRKYEFQLYTNGDYGGEYEIEIYK